MRRRGERKEVVVRRLALGEIGEKIGHDDLRMEVVRKGKDLRRGSVKEKASRMSNNKKKVDGLGWL